MKIKLTRLLLEASDPAIDKLKSLLNKDYETFVSMLGDEIKDPKVQAALESGFEDGDNNDDKVKVEVIVCSVSKLVPTQNEIDVDKSIKYPLSNPSNLETDFKSGPVIIGKWPIVTLNSKHIIDGHHRWSQVYCMNADAEMKCINIQGPSDPIKVLKAVQMAIAADIKKVPISPVDGKNLFTIQEGDFLHLVNQIITDDCVKLFGKYTGVNTKNNIAKYIWKNVLSMRKTSKPISNAPERKYMPQTDQSNSALKKLVSGEINFENPISQ